MLTLYISSSISILYSNSILVLVSSSTISTILVELVLILLHLLSKRPLTIGASINKLFTKVITLVLLLALIVPSFLDSY